MPLTTQQIEKSSINNDIEIKSQLEEMVNKFKKFDYKFLINVESLPDNEFGFSVEFLLLDDPEQHNQVERFMRFYNMSDKDAEIILKRDYPVTYEYLMQFKEYI